MNNGIKDQTVTMAHGAGGRQTSELIDNIFAAQCPPMDLSYRLHFSQGEISENCLSAERSMIWRVWEQSRCI